MVTLKQLIRPTNGWYDSVSRKDKFFLDSVSIPPHAAKKLIRNGELIEDNISRKVWEL